MDKKRSSKIVHILFFIAALYFAIYILLNHDGADIISIVGSGIILLIASYFLFDKLHYEAERQREIDEQNRNEEKKETLLALSEIEKVQKASYMVLKKGSHMLEEQMRMQTEEIKNLSNNIYQATEDISRVAMQTKRLVTATEQIQKSNAALIEIEKSGYQAIVKYNKENTRQLILSNKEGFTNLLSDMVSSVAGLGGQVSNSVHTDFTEILDKYENLSSVMIENTITVSDRIEDISGTLKEYKNIMEDALDQIDSREYKQLASDMAARMPESLINRTEGAQSNSKVTHLDKEATEIRKEIKTDVSSDVKVEDVASTNESFPLYNNYELEHNELDSLLMEAEHNDELDVQSLFKQPAFDEADILNYTNYVNETNSINDTSNTNDANGINYNNETHIKSPINDIGYNFAENEAKLSDTADIANTETSSFGYSNTFSDNSDFATPEVPGVDLSDPNKKMSPDDIAALIAAMTM